MSQDSAVNLREFRIQKKPALSHRREESSGDAPNIIMSNEKVAVELIGDRDRARSETPARDDSEYGSDDENKGGNECEGGAEAPKEEAADAEEDDIKDDDDFEEEEKQEVTSTTSQPTAAVKTSAAATTTATVTNGMTSYGQRTKSETVLEREKKMKYLLERFPGVQAMVVHSVLSRHGFQTEEAAQELAKTRGKVLSTGDYTRWLEEQEREERQAKAKLEESKVAEKESLLKKAAETLKRKATVSGNYESGKKKKRAKRRDSEDFSDDSDDSTKNFTGNDDVYKSESDSEVETAENDDKLTPEKRRVFEFLQTATASELQLMPSCSKKKVDQIIESRPFDDWADLVAKLRENKYLSADILNAAQQVISIRNSIKNLMKKCACLAEDMEKDVFKGAGIKSQPDLLNPSYKLTGYQMVGLNWLAVLHKHGVNGILADEMGLGKTVQVIAFLAYLKETGAKKHTHLVVVPSSTLDNWSTEFQRWCPTMRVFMYFGSTDERRAMRISWSKGDLRDYDVILTTYTMVGSSPEEKKMFKITPMHYVIFDEAHMLKNMNTQRYENLIRINASNRILLTGTPLQNNLLELMSLLIFVMPKIFAGKTEDLKSLFQKNCRIKINELEDKPTFETEQIDQAKRIMKPFVLRRLKKDVLQDLPEKTDSVVKVPMAPTQKEQYDSLVEAFKQANVDGPNSNYNGMTMMSDLRKLSNHPLLLRYHYQYEMLPEIAEILSKDSTYKDTKIEYIIDDLAYMSDFEIHTMTKRYPSIAQYSLDDTIIVNSGKFLFLDEKLDELKRDGHRVLIFSQYVILLNVMEEYLKIRNHSYLRLDGSTSVPLRQSLIDEYTEDESIFIFLLSTKAGGLGINLTAADSVIIHDIDFNPYNDKQAEDRCHRMGQSKPVSVYRLISQGTIEEGMWQMNVEKLKLEKEITAEVNEAAEMKSVVKLLSSALGFDHAKATNLVSSPMNKKS